MRALLSGLSASGVGRQVGGRRHHRGDDRSRRRGVSKAEAGTQPAAGSIGEILLVGCGKMGGAMLEGWLARGIVRNATVVEPGPGAAGFAGRPGIVHHVDAKSLAPDLRPEV